LLALAYEALKGAPSLPVAYNAANEIAVRSFVEEKIGFLEIHRIVEYVLEKTQAGGKEPETIEEVLEQDGKARILAEEIISRTIDGRSK